MSTIAITGAASGIGAATTARLRNQGHTVIGVDLRDTEVIGDLATVEGRQAAVAGVLDACGGVLDGLVTCAGLSGYPGRPGSLLASLNYFGTIEVMEGLRPALARSTNGPSAVAISSNSTTTAPNYSMELVDALRSGDEAAARELADTIDSLMVYAPTKLAVARWVRHSAVSPDWAGAGIRLNAVAPGMIATPMIDEGNTDEFISKQLEMFKQTIALGRAGRPEEIAAVIDLLLSADGGFFCGSILFCDGGTDALLRADDFPSRWSM